MGAASFLLPAAAAAVVSLQLPDDTRAENVARAVASCDAVLGDGACRPSAEALDAPWLATVTWQEGRLNVTLREAAHPDDVLVERALEFSQGDSADERWSAAGLMVAALMAAQGSTSQAATVPEPEPPPPPAPAPTVAPPPPEPEHRVAALPPELPRTFVPSFELLALAGPGLDPGPWRFGGAGRFSLVHGQVRIGPSIGLRVTTASDTVDAVWIDGSLGAAARLTPWSWRLGVTVVAEGLVEHVEAGAVMGTERDGSARVRGGARLGLRTGFRLADWLAPMVWADVSVLRPAVDVRVQGETVGKFSPVGATLGLGIVVCPSRCGP